MVSQCTPSKVSLLSLGPGGNRAVYMCPRVRPETGCPLLCVPQCPFCLCAGGSPCPCPHVCPAGPTFRGVYMLAHI